jgi:AAA+ superfamily predicted ATPase
MITRRNAAGISTRLSNNSPPACDQSIRAEFADEIEHDRR